jgi:RNA polymerase sigma factor (sigma-70 family)
MGRLGGRERKVLQLRYGLNGHAAMTLREAGETLGISRERVRQIEVRAIRRLRDRIDPRLPRFAEATSR